VSKLGLVQAGSAATDMAISGDGFFVVSKDVAGTIKSLTRAGSFRPDEQGNLKNVAGQYLMGWPVGPDGTVGNVDYESLNGLQRVNTSAAGMSAVATTDITFTGNVPSSQTGAAAPTDPFRSSVEYYDALGNSQRLYIEWQPTTTENNWTLRVTDSNGAEYGTVDVEFAATGTGAGAPASYTNIVSTSGNFGFDPATGAMTIDAAASGGTQPISIKFGAPGAYDGVTQYSSDYAPKTLKNGSSAGTLQSYEITEDGKLIGVFSNNARRALWQIPIATVTNPDGLSRGDGNTFNVSASSGDARLNDAGKGSAGSIAGGALEGSNVDIAEELTDMIVTQRAYSTNAKIIQTADEMLEEATRLKR
jgi:flagellar hook protein FlgE